MIIFVHFKLDKFAGFVFLHFERTGADQSSCNWIVYRLGDIYLMKAEALSQLSRWNEATDALNTIRERANMPPLSIGNSTVLFEDAIMEERALELAFEGKRWFDLLRMGRRNNYARKDKLLRSEFYPLN